MMKEDNTTLTFILDPGEQAVLHSESDKNPSENAVPDGVLYSPGNEPEKIHGRLERLFEKLDAAYPDKVITGLNKHTHWAETVTELYRKLGYPDSNSFLKAYGYTPTSAGRPSTLDPEAAIAHLKELYPNGTSMALGELQLAVPDIPWKNLMNKSKELFGMSFSRYLAQEGILTSGRQAFSPAGPKDEKEVDELVDSLIKRYAGKEKPSSFKTLVEDNPDLPLPGLDRIVKKLFNKTTAVYLAERGVLQSGHGIQIPAEEKLAAIEKALIEKYKGKTPLPKSISQIKQENQELQLSSLEMLVKRVKGITSKDYFTSLGILAAEESAEERLESLISALKERYGGEKKKAKTISQLKEQNTDLPVSSLRSLVKKVTGKTASQYLMEQGILVDPVEEARLRAEYITAQTALQKKSFRTDLPVNELPRYYYDRFISETSGNPYYLKAIDDSTETTVLSTMVDYHLKEEKDANGCVVRGKIMLSCDGSRVVRVTDGIEVIGSRAFNGPSGYHCNEDIDEIILPDSVTRIFYNSFDYRTIPVAMNIPKGYLLRTFKLPDVTRWLLASVWKYNASILDWVSVYITQDRIKYGGMCEKAFAVEPDATAAAFIALACAHENKYYTEAAFRWIFENRALLSQQILDGFCDHGRKTDNEKIIEVFEPISSAVPGGYCPENDRLALSAYLKTFESPEYERFSKTLSRDPNYKGSDYFNIHAASVILSLYYEEWERCSRTVRGNYSEVSVLANGTELKPIKFCDDIISEIDKDVFIGFLKSKVTSKDYRSYIIPFAHFASEKDINWFISEIRSAKKGNAQSRYRGDSSQEALYLSDTRAAVLYFEKKDLLEAYARMRGMAENELRINNLYDMDFGPDGRKTYDLGGRLVELRLNKDMTLSLYDMAAGKEIKSIPKTGSDPQKYEEAKADYSDKKSNLKKVAKSVCDDLLSRFLSGSGYEPATWNHMFSSNPVLKYIAELIVWSQGGCTFTVTDTGLIMSDGAPYVLSEESIILAHPMELDEATVSRWQKYFVSNSLRQPFDQIWEPVVDFETVSSDMYKGCEIPLYRFNGREKHGITLDKESEFNHRAFKHEYTELYISLSDCSIDWEMTDGDICDATMQSTITIDRFSCRKHSRQANHIISYLDKCTVFGQIRRDDTSVINKLPEFTAAQIAEFIKTAQEAKAINVLSALLEYNQAHFADIDPLEEFTLDL